MKKTLSISDAAPRDATVAIKAAGISPARLDRLHDIARNMRRNPSEAEKLLWAQLSGSKVGGYQFRRQVVVGSAIVGFLCTANRLAVELASVSPEDPEADARRDQKLSSLGLYLLHVTEADVTGNIESVVQKIGAALESLRPEPAPQANRTPRRERY
jgi:very-short-patch-repair endonuclease